MLAIALILPDLVSVLRPLTICGESPMKDKYCIKSPSFQSPLGQSERYRNVKKIKIVAKETEIKNLEKACKWDKVLNFTAAGQKFLRKSVNRGGRLRSVCCGIFWDLTARTPATTIKQKKKT